MSFKWLDATALLAACGSDDGVLARVVTALRRELPRRVASAQEAWRQGDARALRESAHKLHGMISAASTAAGALASDIEDEATAGHLAQAGVLLEALAPIACDILVEIEGVSVDQLSSTARTILPGGRGRRPSSIS
jgi:dihydrodipicolinate synthase/N-acetylneuraminate lyase